MKDIFAEKFIVLDGPDGCGKSTQSKLLAEYIEKTGTPTVTFRDPGTTAIGEKIRQILLNPEHVAMDTRTELLLYMAARAQLWKEKIAPALNAGKCVVLDRWLSSTCAYQGFAGGFGMDKIISIADDSLEKTWPDVTIILDIDLKISKTRLGKIPDRMEAKSAQYHQKVRDGFGALAKQRPDFFVVDAGEPVETVHGKIVKTITETLTGG